VRAQTPPTWTVASSTHFRVYSQTGEGQARSALQWFEQLHAFFQQAGFPLSHRPPVRVIGFRSQADYEQYRLRPTADAYYVGDGTNNCIVVPSLSADKAPIAAHEYAHIVLHASDMRFPSWLSEGLAEYFSTVQIGQRSVRLGGDLPMRSQTLRHSTWMPLTQLLTTTAQTRADAGLFYAQSWALTEMLILSPEYKGRFPQLLSKLALGVPSVEAFTTVYNKSPEAITGDAHQWIESGKSQATVLPPVNAGNVVVQVSPLTVLAARCLTAGLLFDIGELNRAEAAYRELQREFPANAEVEAALGNIALRRGDRESARRGWEAAMQHGIDDANLCYRYAVLAGDMGLPEGEVSAALERAVALQPEFDDARYKLALLDNNTGKYEAALKQLLAIKSIGPARAYHYWSSIAYAHEELGERDQAKIAATQAMQYAATKEEQDRAAQLLYVAETDLTMRATRDAQGNLQYVTTRVKHGSAHPNPFVEPEDALLRVHGRLIRVDCAHDVMTGVGIDTGKATLTLGIANPMRVLMQNAPQEFACGPQSPVPVTVEYAAQRKENSDGLLRGMEFEKTPN
jgi:tetratricopeptide (TPR) repeat protein